MAQLSEFLGLMAKILNYWKTDFSVFGFYPVSFWLVFLAFMFLGICGYFIGRIFK